MRVADFDFALPDALIAQTPRPRGQSRLLVVDRQAGTWREHRFDELPTLLTPGDLFVANVGKAKADIVAIASAVDQYAIENNGKYPESLEVLVTPDEHGFSYLGQETVPKDPWGQE